MAAMPDPMHTTAHAIVQWRERTTPQGHRPHLGASVMGHACTRYLWLTFRWVHAQQFDGRMLRLFARGKLEEPRVIEELRGIGCEVWADDGTAQYRVSTLGGHAGGSMDGVVLGLPEAPKTPHVLEIKTHSAKSFADLLKRGVKDAKPQHYAQMQVYMALAGLDRALYWATDKDTDAVYLERVELDRAYADRMLERARQVIEAAEPPPRLSDDPSWYECKWCGYYDLCHGTAAPPEVNCRTCVHSTPVITDGDDAPWRCERKGCGLSVEQQRAGCDDHLFIPTLLSAIAEAVDASPDSITYRVKGGGKFANGPAPHLSSREIAAAFATPMLLADQAVRAIKQAMPTARVISGTAFDDMADSDFEAA